MPFVSNSGGDSGGDWFSFDKLTKSVSAINEKAVADTRAETQKLLNSARNGGFHITPEGVKPLREALVRMQERLDSLSATSAHYLGQSPKLGSHDYGKTVAQHTLKGGSSEPGSASVVLEQLRTVLEDALAALQHAEDNYRNRESEVVSALKSKQE
ncbi:hypothetical protein [Saccharomonospora viridis]|jgi:hypothetical protein|uniref:hypothetical protein n=1 Tax=Saccharomonospora viridis TaxID=1852 RepID=UPI0023F01CDE|nr:hypothetical protein [Saccharomonospora viridis]